MCCVSVPTPSSRGWHGRALLHPQPHHPSPMQHTQGAAVVSAWRVEDGWATCSASCTRHKGQGTAFMA